MPKNKVSLTSFAFTAATSLLAAMMTFTIVVSSGCERLGNVNAGVVVEEGSMEPVAQVSTNTNVGGGEQRRFEVSIRNPAGPPRVELTGVDAQGRSASVACSTCHGVRKANMKAASAETLDEFHQGMVFSHGKIACYACHHPGDADFLRLADGTSVAYQDVMTLCSQCHSSQATAFAHGAHGGMNGYWDLSRGPQSKNNCIDCHDPHSPRYPKMVVGFKPHDRFNEAVGHDHASMAGGNHGSD